MSGLSPCILPVCGLAAIIAGATGGTGGGCAGGIRNGRKCIWAWTGGACTSGVAVLVTGVAVLVTGVAALVSGGGEGILSPACAACSTSCRYAG